MSFLDTNSQLEVICGPMFAGKTTELMSRVARAHAAGLRVLAIKPTRDTRYGHSELVTHTGLRIPALAVDRIADALEHAHEFVAIDEIHFFPTNASLKERSSLGVCLSTGVISACLTAQRARKRSSSARCGFLSLHHAQSQSGLCLTSCHIPSATDSIKLSGTLMFPLSDHL